VLAEAARVQHRADRLAVSEVARLGKSCDVLAEVRRAHHTAAAAATRDLPRDEHRVAGLQVLDAGADRLDLPRALVAEQDRREARVSHLRHIGVAETRDEHADAHLPRSGWRDPQPLQPRPVAERVEHEAPGAYSARHC